MTILPRDYRSENSYNAQVLLVELTEGSLQTEFLTGCFEGKPSDCVPHQLWNFAFAGADVDKALWVSKHSRGQCLQRLTLHRLPLHHNFTVDLVDEVKQWVQFASHVVPHPAAETLVAWWIGINDTGDTLNRNVCTPASC